MVFEISGPIVYWRGPAPWYFVEVPEAESAQLQEMLSAITYGWGMVPVTARLGGTAWDTAMFPRQGRWMLPLKVAVRRAEQVDEGDEVTVRVTVAD